MYEDYFGLDRPPFKITPDTSLFYEGGKRGDILAALVYAIHRGEGIIKVVGEVGSGKTMLCRMLQLKLPDSVEIVYIANPSVSPEDILFVIAHELSLPVTKEATKHEVMHQLHDYLLQKHTDDRQVVLFIEEAQGMPLETLEEVRLLSNLETDEHKLLQIILFGQPELDENLSQQSIRQLRERITHNFALEPLSSDEIHNYLNFRMREVGYTGPELINKGLARKIEQHSAGLLRRINIIADKILLSAFAEGTHNLSVKHVTAAVDDSAFDSEARQRSRGLLWLGLLLAALALAFGLYQTHSLWSAQRVSGSVPQADTVLPVEQQDETPLQNSAPPVAGVQLASMQEPVTLEIDAVPAADQAVPPDVPAAIQQAIANDLDEPVLSAEPEVDATVVAAPAPTRVALTETATAEPLAVQKAIDQATASDQLADRTGLDLSLELDDNEWLQAKLEQSKAWLSQVDSDKVSIQVLMRSKSAARELVYYLRNEWPLELSKTYLYEVQTESRSIYRVFYSEFDSLTKGRDQLEKLPESVKINSPYLHSVYRMQKALL
ncbi:MAG: AAA family ATPase [Gammaproteobacteria bacterium]|nr:AAA family ATPase [Gammaproteobacteria bacterium]